MRFFRLLFLVVYRKKRLLPVLLVLCLLLNTASPMMAEAPAAVGGSPAAEETTGTPETEQSETPAETDEPDGAPAEPAVEETDVPEGYRVIYRTEGATVTVINRHEPADTVIRIVDYDIPLSIGLNMNEGDCLN